MAELTFKRPKISNHNEYNVYSADGILLGRVRKVENWTVRGTRVSWEPYAKARYLGSDDSRKAAAAILAT